MAPKGAVVFPDKVSLNFFMLQQVAAGTLDLYQAKEPGEGRCRLGAINAINLLTFAMG